MPKGRLVLHLKLESKLSVLLNISHKHDESVQVLNEIRDLLKQNNNGDGLATFEKDLGN
jgi:mannitol/fructose-specific phosphotransferase system IIA component